ncbi:hypothetical protein [Horticoccus sp. 23ND18S-11]|uniref:hypothetical protein n=1 Tax=Horticoccus sp. 23ND18S-11 TaxID=3391832 RepID=UPI0039C91756
MKFIFSFKPRSHRRSTLRDLHAFGLVRVFRQHSFFRLWEPLREQRSREEPFLG